MKKKLMHKQEHSMVQCRLKREAGAESAGVGLRLARQAGQRAQYGRRGRAGYAEHHRSEMVTCNEKL